MIIHFFSQRKIKNMSVFKGLLNSIGKALVELYTDRNPEHISTFPHKPDCSKTQALVMPPLPIMPFGNLADSSLQVQVCPECHESALIK